MSIVNEPSCFIDILYDAGHDDYCFKSRYRFENKELIDRFIEHVNTVENMLVWGEIIVESEKYKDLHRKRPKFNELSLAKEDLECCIKYCLDYFDQPLYKYDESVFKVELHEYELLYLSQLTKKLKIENNALKIENEALKNIIKHNLKAI